MKKIFVVITALLLVVGCASIKPLNMAVMITEAKNISPDGNFYLIDIPSRGVLADAASIAAKGGGAARQLRENIKKVESSGGGSILVTSSNPAIPSAHIKGALDSLEDKVENVIIIYGGDKKYSDSIKYQVEAKGMTYEFVDAYKKM
jgi:hypothetical protein